MLDQDFGADADQDQSADQVQLEVYLAAEVVAEVDAKGGEQEGDDPYRQGFQCNADSMQASDMPTASASMLVAMPNPHSVL